MGYAPTRTYSYLEVYTAVASFGVAAIAADYDINNVAIPDFKEPLNYAFVDVHIHAAEDTSAANNFLQSGQWGIEDTGATFRASGTILPTTIWTPANTRINGEFIIPGTTDISSYITSGGTQMIRFDNTRANGANLQLDGVYGVLRLYFMG